jgi:hypothetical protein
MEKVSNCLILAFLGKQVNPKGNADERNRNQMARASQFMSIFLDA